MIAAMLLLAAVQAPTIAPAAPLPVEGSARELVGLLGIDQQLDFTFKAIMPLLSENIASAMANTGSLDVNVRAQLASETGRAQIKAIIAEEVLAGFRATFPKIKDTLAREYATRFTAVELADLLAFYRSASGAKLVRITPDLQQSLSKIGERIGATVATEALPRVLERITGKSAATPTPRT